MLALSGGGAARGPPGEEGGDAFTWQRQGPGAPVSYPGEASSGALAGKERQIRARVLAGAAGMLCSSRPPAAYVLSQFLLPLLRPKVGRRGKGTFLPCNPELLPRHLERGPPREPLRAVAPGTLRSR